MKCSTAHCRKEYDMILHKNGKEIGLCWDCWTKYCRGDKDDNK